MTNNYNHAYLKEHKGTYDVIFAEYPRPNPNSFIAPPDKPVQLSTEYIAARNKWAETTIELEVHPNSLKQFDKLFQKTWLSSNSGFDINTALATGIEIPLKYILGHSTTSTNETFIKNYLYDSLFVYYQEPPPPPEDIFKQALLEASEWRDYASQAERMATPYLEAKDVVLTRIYEKYKHEILK